MKLMCLNIIHSKEFKANLITQFIKENLKIATKDIIVYKRVIGAFFSKSKDTYVTPYRHMRIDLNTHYYQKGNKKFGITINDYCAGINQGLHSFATLRKAKSNAFEAIVIECIIPKGSEYFYTGGCYCSDNLITTDKVYK